MMTLTLLAQLALAQPGKPPPCSAELKGVLWNFGTEEVPVLKRCDGTQYTPWAARTAAHDRANSPATPATLSAAANFKADKKTCEDSCDKAGRDCRSKRCEMDLDSAGCKNRCLQIRISCRARCSAE